MTATATLNQPTLADDVFADDMFTGTMFATLTANLAAGFGLGLTPATDPALIGKTITTVSEVSIENGFTKDTGLRFTFTDGTTYTLIYPTPAPF